MFSAITSYAKLPTKPSLAGANMGAVFRCFSSLQAANSTTFPGIHLKLGKLLVLPENINGKAQNKLIFFTEQNAYCATVPTKQGIGSGDSLIRIDPALFGLEDDAYLTTIDFKGPTEGEKRMKTDEPPRIGPEGGPYGEVIFPNKSLKINIVNLKPQKCPLETKSGEALYNWLKIAIQAQVDIVNYEVDYLKKETSTNVATAFNECKKINNKNLNAIINDEEIKLKGTGDQEPVQSGNPK